MVSETKYIPIPIPFSKEHEFRETEEINRLIGKGYSVINITQYEKENEVGIVVILVDKSEENKPVYPAAIHLG
ncbi:hypothetical protein [Asinibacterium sp. OR53]|uniref:hypothetical protein n=1 Tax=Asinibacterium sp. OR53 TaxID=925409 RepID=UPI000479C61F|nr:hypothetical protein [Asinibacterium sp. OR53]